MIIETTLHTGRYAILKVPEGATNIRLSKPSGMYLDYDLGKEIGSVEMPPGNFQIVGIGRELTEVQWKEIVDRQNGSVGKYKDYSITGSLAKYGTYLLGAATESGFSWLRSHGADETFLILKEVK